MTIDDIKLSINNEKIFKECFKDLHKFMMRKKWYGACHATTAVMYAICRVLDIECVPCIGEVYYKTFFDHSWLLINNNIFDLAITMPFEMSFSNGPIFNSINLSSGEEKTIKYGVIYSGLDEQATIVYSMSIYSYLYNSPSINLIQLIIDILKQNGVFVTRSRLEKIMGDDVWKYVDNHE